MPAFSRLGVVAAAIVASVALGFGSHARPTYVRLFSSLADSEGGSLMEILDRRGLSARSTADGGIEIQQGESKAALTALADRAGPPIQDLAHHPGPSRRASGPMLSYPTAFSESPVERTQP